MPSELKAAKEASAGTTVRELFRRFPDDRAAEHWFEAIRWGESGRCCPDCGSTRTVTTRNRRPLPYRCQDCRRHFSVRKGTVMQASKIGYQKWAIATCLMVAGPNGISSMELHRALGITQKSAWFLMQRISEGGRWSAWRWIRRPAIRPPRAPAGGTRRT